MIPKTDEKPFGLPEWQVEEKTERQCSLDGEVGVLRLPATRANRAVPRSRSLSVTTTGSRRLGGPKLDHTKSSWRPHFVLCVGWIRDLIPLVWLSAPFSNWIERIRVPRLPVRGIRAPTPGFVIGSIRREGLDHVIGLNATGLHRALVAYVAYYMQSRTHLALGKDTPSPRPVTPQSVGRVVAISEVGGLHHRYDRIAA